ncbi:MAG: hypothetical protein CMP59_05450 [Flavobacteriales bacterium]|nr:hypothetical protein [Flavobacteriales bacterium]|tara:strand:- start:94 stop:435 length:342 start_codon:yes stop_codon:yes gene_type:complete
MKLIFDQNISFRILKKLNPAFEDSLHVSEARLNNANDSDIWKFAKKHHFTIVTFDADFYDISIMKGHPPKIIWVRSGNSTTDSLAKLLNKNQEVIEEFLSSKDYQDIACLEIE